MSNVKDTHIERWLLFQEGALRCAWCSAPLTFESASRDHLIPRGRGGRFGGANVVPACEPCNWTRGCQRLSNWVGRAIRAHGPLPQSTQRMLLLLCVEFRVQAKRQGVTVEFVQGLPTFPDVEMPMAELGLRYREVARRRREEIQMRREVAARRREARALVPA